MYVIRRDHDGKYVTPPGQEHSYTDKMELARLFSTRDEAQRELCPENESIVSIYEAAPCRDS